MIPNGIDREALPLGLRARTRALLAPLALDAAPRSSSCPSGSSPRKNIDLAVRVLAALRAAGDDARLLVTGPPDPHDPTTDSLLGELRLLRAELGLGAAAHFFSRSRAARFSDASSPTSTGSPTRSSCRAATRASGCRCSRPPPARLPVVCTDLPSAAGDRRAGDAAYFSPDEDPVDDRRARARPPRRRAVVRSRGSHQGAIRLATDLPRADRRVAGARGRRSSLSRLLGRQRRPRRHRGRRPVQPVRCVRGGRRRNQR